MQAEALSRSHQELLDYRFKRMQLNLSEYAFANLYLFRQVHYYEIIHCKDVYIRGRMRDGSTFLMPTTPIEEIIFPDLIECLSTSDFLFPIPEVWKPRFDSSLFEIEYKDEDSDYLFNAEKMRTYQGRHLSGRRNLVKQFLDKYPSHRVFNINEPARIDDAYNVLEQWNQHATVEKQTNDYSECKEAIQLIESLKLKGRIYYVDEMPVGFIIGEPLNEHVFAYHFAKGLIEYKGVYQYIYQEYTQSLDAKFELINFEQDLGSSDLKHSKRAYLPDLLAPKLRIRLKWGSRNEKAGIGE